MKRVIVTGSTGLIGKEVSTFLEKTGYKVIRCSRSLGQDLTDESVVKKFFSEKRMEWQCSQGGKYGGSFRHWRSALSSREPKAAASFALSSK